MKLYTFVGEYTHPQSGFGNAPVWHGTKDDVTYASMDDACLAVFNAAQDGKWTLGTSADVAVAKSISPKVEMILAQIPKDIRKKYTVDDEFAAHRTQNKTVLDDIAAIVAARKAEVGVLFNDAA
jgi:hypothetical protein